MKVGILSTGTGSGIGVERDWAKKEIRRSASLPFGKNSVLKEWSSCDTKNVGALNVRFPSCSEGTFRTVSLGYPNNVINSEKRYLPDDTIAFGRDR